MKRTLATLALAAFAAALLPSRACAEELDGTKWKARPKGMLAIVMFWRTDELIFENGRFTSADCIPYGFKAGPYDSKKDADKVSWSATQTNDQGETMEWSGTQKGRRMKGHFTWTKKDGKKKTYRWKAHKLTREHPGEHPKAK